MKKTLMTCLALMIVTSPARADLAPTTPTFQLAWGNSGPAPGQFNLPFGVATDIAGNVYVLDRGDARIQKFDAFGDLIQQWAPVLPLPPHVLSEPSFLAVDFSGNVYVTDSGNDRVVKFASDGTYVTEWGGSGSAPGQFDNPYGIAVDASGNVYVSEWNGCRVQVFTSAGVYVRGWGSPGSGPGQFTNGGGVAVDPKGNVFVVDQANRVQKFTSTGTYLTQWGTTGSGNGQFSAANGVAVDAVGNVYVAEYTNNRVQKFANDGTYLTQWGTPGTGDGQFTNPVGVAVDLAGDVLVTDFSGNRIERFSGAGVPAAAGTPGALLQWTVGGVQTSIATDVSSHVYVSVLSPASIQKFTSTGAPVTQWSCLVGTPKGLAADASGNVYVTEFGVAPTVVRYGTNGAYRQQWSAAGYGLAIDPAGRLFVAGPGVIQAFSGSGSLLGQWSWSGGRALPNSDGLAVDPAGNVYVADWANDRIQKFASNGVPILQWGSTGSGNGQFSHPQAIATDAAGHVYVADDFRTQEFTGNGTYLTEWSVPAVDLATDPAGNVYSLGAGVGKFASPPTVALISDVGHDQGGQVQIHVLRTSADSPGSGVVVTGYEVFRRNDALAANRSRHSSVVGAPHSDAASRPAVDLDGWTQVGSFPAYGESEYDVVVPTSVDATPSSVDYSAFLVRAVTTDPLKYFDSAPGYGYSVDNLSPPPPTVFTAAYQSSATHLHWSASTASDFATFKLYRGASANFALGAGNLLAATTDTGYVDVGAAGSYYKLAAVDRNGNESPYVLVGPAQTTGVDPAPGPDLEFALTGVSPNPATSHALTVRFTLPNVSRATLELIDVAGRTVTKREVGALGAGAHSLDLARGTRLMPGLYFVRLTHESNSSITRVTVLE